MLTKYSAWSYKWDKAYNQIAILLKYAPDNKEYKLFSARLIAWNVLNATPEEIERAKGILLSILKDDPKNQEYRQKAKENIQEEHPSPST